MTQASDSEPSAVVTSPRRPDGVSLFAVFQWVVTVFAFLMLYLIWGLESAGWGRSEGLTTATRVLFTYLAVRMLVGPVLAVGLWRLRKWAWWGAVIELSTGSLLNLAFLLLLSGGIQPMEMAPIIASTAWVVYLTRRNVRTAFGFVEVAGTPG